ncbi:MAG TPA: EI24 domain-containing protein [Ramlibacter sp.]|jgi:hypothetical protein|uniref:EI24 domain-containing protein n=1 Tax=Ramlibacter sp. TaxID=1917967 RepID=UPI002D69C961|nr:EI24 domain-containing protein [Ramlibacter sp.]HZY20532.1 EI24 domain-containing protein [Ramlibacter sp.]
MGLVLDSFWRAVAYCLHPRVVALSILPLLLMVLAAIGLGWLFWDPAVDAVFRWLESSALLSRAGDWLRDLGLGGLRTVVAPLVVIFLATPVIVLCSLLAVATLMTPALVRLVAERRFPGLAREQGGSLLGSIAWSLGSTLLALVALVVSLPLWLIPPLVFVLPPLIWGWLAYRVMAFDALAEHATREERRLLLKQHRLPLLGIGVLTGYLGAAPSVVWASGALFAAAFVILVPLAIWIYTLVFAFSSLWFGHYCLAALEQLRARQGPPPVPVQPAPVALEDVHST